MTKTQINTAIAESIGWTDIRLYSTDNDRLWGMDPPPDPDFTSVPDYTTDLNEMHEIESTLNENQRTCYIQHLVNIAKQLKPPFFHAITASAAYRAEAYLRTINKWIE